jgi:protein-tyrosine phosphatase
MGNSLGKEPMIDTHLHILLGVDDGPQTMEEALALARALVEEGIHTAIATPHFNDLFPQRSAAEITERVNELQQVLDRHGIRLRLFAGHEALIKPGLVDDIQAGRLATLNGSRYLLLELWNSSWLADTERVIFELRAFGIMPIIAHLERCRMIQQKPDQLVDLLQRGVSTQLTASSLVGTWGKAIQRCAETLLKKRLICCIASDAHSLCKRPPDVTRGLHSAFALIDQAYFKFLTEIFPAAIIKDEKCTL